MSFPLLPHRESSSAERVASPLVTEASRQLETRSCSACRREARKGGEGMHEITLARFTGSDSSSRAASPTSSRESACEEAFASTSSAFVHATSPSLQLTPLTQTLLCLGSSLSSLDLPLTAKKIALFARNTPTTTRDLFSHLYVRHRLLMNFLELEPPQSKIARTIECSSRVLTGDAVPRTS